MLRTYIFNERENNWIEENIAILNHDLCAILDEEERVIHVWKGPKSSKEKFKKAINAIETLMKQNSDLNLRVELSSKKFPIKVKEKIDKLLQGLAQKDEFSKYGLSRFISIRLYFFSLLITLILPIISVVNLASFIGWIPSGNNFIVMAEYYDNWLTFSLILIIISIVTFIISLFIGIFEQEYQIIIISIIGFLNCLGIAIYLQQGIFIFAFQDGSTESSYLISRFDLFLFLGLIAGGMAIFEVPNIIKLTSFLKMYKKFLL